MSLYDPRQCELGEGPFWHPERQQFFWFDIVNAKLLSRTGGNPLEWQFADMVSAAGWTGHDTLLIVSERRLLEFNISTAAIETVTLLEDDNPATRSNDGRADPFGGFWVGTMGKNAEPNAGAIYRYYRGELRKLFTDITIPNSICFAPDGSHGFYTDSTIGQIMKQELDDDGWPKGAPEVFVDLSKQSYSPDGSVTDAQGNLWNAQWGASRVAVYDHHGALSQTVNFPARHTSCPAFGGRNFDKLFCTTAMENLSPEIREAEPSNGQTFSVNVDAKGWREPRVIL